MKICFLDFSCSFHPNDIVKTLATLFLGISLLVKHSFEGWEKILLDVFSKKEGFVLSTMLLHAPFTGVIYFEEKKSTCWLKALGISPWAEYLTLL